MTWRRIPPLITVLIFGSHAVERWKTRAYDVNEAGRGKQGATCCRCCLWAPSA
jgi:hypothetical protein